MQVALHYSSSSSTIARQLRRLLSCAKLLGRLQSCPQFDSSFRRHLDVLMIFRLLTAWISRSSRILPGMVVLRLHHPLNLGVALCGVVSSSSQQPKGESGEYCNTSDCNSDTNSCLGACTETAATVVVTAVFIAAIVAVRIASMRRGSAGLSRRRRRRGSGARHGRR